MNVCVRLQVGIIVEKIHEFSLLLIANSIAGASLPTCALVGYTGQGGIEEYGGQGHYRRFQPTEQKQQSRFGFSHI